MFGIVAAALAARKRRSVGTWAALGAILGPVGLIVLGLAPPGRCWYCAARTDGWLTVCGFCGEDVRGPRKPEGAPQARDGRTWAAGDMLAAAPAGPAVPVGPGKPAPSAPIATELPVGRPARRGPRADSSTAMGAPPGPVARLRSRASPDGSNGFGLEETATTRPPSPVRTRSRQARTAAAPPAPRELNTPFLAAAVPPESARMPTAAPRTPSLVILASGVYVTGSRSLIAGSRYGIALMGDQLQILGPVDVDPSATAIRRPLRGLDATGVSGRVIITADSSKRDRFALVFMAIAGGSPESVADQIVTAVGALRAVRS